MGTGDEVIERGLHQAFVLGIERRGCLVEDENRRVAQRRPGNRDSLLLSAREFAVLAADDGIVSVGEGGDEVMRGSGSRGGLDLRDWNVGRVLDPGAAHRYVHADAGVEEKRFLRHDADG